MFFPNFLAPAPQPPAYDSARNVTRLVLSGKLRYTHLGEIVPVAGDVHKRTIDMRAEVAVLNRSIVIEGDESSPKSLYGGQIQVGLGRG